VLVRLFFLTIQLIGSAPNVSNFAWYSGVLTVITLFGALLDVTGDVELVEPAGIVAAVAGLGPGAFPASAEGDGEAPG